MAHGPAPKHASQRRNRAPKLRGEWVDLPDRNPDPPPPPKKEWPGRTKDAWRAWWTDPVSTLWTPADHSAVLDLADLHALMVGGNIRVAAEVRQRADLLGLSQKGRRDLRWRDAAPDSVAPAAGVAVMDEYRAMLADAG